MDGVLLLDKMNNNNTKDFFDFINEKCLFYIIEIGGDGGVGVRWKNIKREDYNISTTNKIIIRIQRTKSSSRFLIDCFQCHQSMIYWKAFHFHMCSHYEIHHEPGEELMDFTLYFDNKEKLYIHKINVEVVFILQDFFNGFM